MGDVTVLVVDDEARMRKLIKDFLIQKGFSVLEAEDGERAIDVFESNKNKIGIILIFLLTIIVLSCILISVTIPDFI